MKRSAKAARSQGPAKLIGFLLILVMLLGGLYLGTESTLTLSRDGSGAVSAVNAWRLAGHVTLLQRSVTHLKDARMQAVDLSISQQRSTAYRDVFGRLVVPEELLLIGDNQIAYPYRDDLSLIRTFIKNPSNRQLVIRQPVDIRRLVASWALLLLAGLSIIGWVVKLTTGRDPLANAPNKVKPLRPAVGTALFLGTIVFFIWFFNMGHHVFGPVATGKVRLLMDSATQNDAAGIRNAAASGVYLDVRDRQGMTALILAARAGAEQAADALLKAGANPDIRDIGDNTALMSAVQMRKSGVAARLLDAGADVEAADTNGRTVLHLAAQGGDAALIARILRAGAKVNQADLRGWTPLMFAAAGGSPESVRALLDAQADPRRKLADGRSAADMVQGDAGMRERLRQAAQ